ncbi:hypothetical protein ANCDUO_19485, partial [Ancylostoma duodenale]
MAKSEPYAERNLSAVNQLCAPAAQRKCEKKTIHAIANKLAKPPNRSELYVDDPGREGKIDVEVDVSFPYLKCEYLGVDIQDENGRHEVGFIDKTEKIPLKDNGCRFKSKFEINK